MASKAKILKSIQHFDNVGKEIERFEERIRDAIAEPDCSAALIYVLKSKVENYEKKIRSGIFRIEYRYPNFPISKPIDVLLGAEIYANLLEGLPILGPAGTPAAIPTKLGYILSRKIYAPPLQESIVKSTLNDQLSELWKLEEVPKTNAEIQIPDPCEESFSKSVKRNNEDWINNDLKEELSSAKILTTCTVEADSVLNSTPLIVESNPLETIISKFSNFTKLIRVIALCKRFINNCCSGSKMEKSLKATPTLLGSLAQRGSTSLPIQAQVENFPI
ncbi:hypothetical protein TNCT_519951 [Trichonephila clavata]|uniref:Uncharacterized protein n=1 Tax=Trichonephila clavata TaxID=2740835 RepID=A0A8X6FQH7_TRICU|nr:hypothetical protein TNCT_519951 [Trichonephila clavata]